MNLWCDATWVVVCAPQVMAERIRRDRQMTQEQVNARLAAQSAVEEKVRRAQVVIDNSGSEDYTLSQVVRALGAIRYQSVRDKSQALGQPPASAPASPVAPVPAESPRPAPIAPKAPPTPPPAAAPTEITAEAISTQSRESPPAPRTQEAPPREAAPWLRTPAKPRLDVEVRRAKRADLQALSNAISKLENRQQPMTRAEALRRLGEGGFRIAVVGDRIVGLATWTAENLVATVREIWTESPEVTPIVLPKLLTLIEGEANALFCEVVLLLIDQSAMTLAAEAQSSGYEKRELSTLHPMWRSVVSERLQPADAIWLKQLREEVTTKPF